MGVGEVEGRVVKLVEDCFKAIQLTQLFSFQSNLLIHALSRELSSLRLSCCRIPFYICKGKNIKIDIYKKWVT